jgi:hypothetical protein
VGVLEADQNSSVGNLATSTYDAIGFGQKMIQVLNIEWLGLDWACLMPCEGLIKDGREIHGGLVEGMPVTIQLSGRELVAAAVYVACSRVWRVWLVPSKDIYSDISCPHLNLLIKNSLIDTESSSLIPDGSGRKSTSSSILTVYLQGVPLARLFEQVSPNSTQS